MAIHTRLVTYIYLVTYYVRLNLVMLVFVRPNSSYARPKLKVIGQMSCQVKYLFAALVSETKPNHILFKSYKHCCIMQLAYNKVMKYRRISSGN